MTREEFIAKWRHEWAGMVLDAALTQRRGADLAMGIAGLLEKIDRHLGTMYSTMQPPLPNPQNNGKPPIKLVDPKPVLRTP